MTSLNGKNVRVTGLCEEKPPVTKACDVVFWYFLWSAPEKTVKQTIETPVIWDAIALIMTSL